MKRIKQAYICVFFAAVVATLLALALRQTEANKEERQESLDEVISKVDTRVKTVKYQHRVGNEPCVIYKSQAGAKIICPSRTYTF